MISAITNPFLYGYFNETFQDGLTKIVSLFCPQFLHNKNRQFFDSMDIPSLKTTFERHQSGGFASRSTFYQTKFSADINMKSIKIRQVNSTFVSIVN